jgi:hypothetical protein
MTKIQLGHLLLGIGCFLLGTGLGLVICGLIWMGYLTF